MSIIGLTVNKLLTEQKMSVSELAAKLGMTKQNLYQILKANDIHVNTLQKISDVLGVPITYFFESKENIVEEQKPIYGGGRRRVLMQIEIDQDNNLLMNLGPGILELLKK